jgi:hypothetical protein
MKKRLNSEPTLVRVAIKGDKLLEIVVKCFKHQIEHGDNFLVSNRCQLANICKTIE